VGITALLGSKGLAALSSLLSGLFGGGKPDLPAGLSWVDSPILVNRAYAIKFNPGPFGAQVPVMHSPTPQLMFTGWAIADDSTGLTVGYWDEGNDEAREWLGYTLEGVPISPFDPSLSVYANNTLPSMNFPEGAVFRGYKGIYPDAIFPPRSIVPPWDFLEEICASKFTPLAAPGFVEEFQERAAINASVWFGKGPAAPGAPVSGVGAGSISPLLIGGGILVMLLLLKGK